MKLMTKEIEKKLPKLYEMDGLPEEEIKVPVKFFNPTGRGTWYALEYDGEDILYGLAYLQVAELGYFSLRELRDVRVGFGLSIERDLHWDPETTLADVREAIKKGTLL